MKKEELLNKIYVNIKESPNQDNTFTNNHTRFDIKITYYKEDMYIEYQCNTNYKKPNKKDIIECVISDAQAYEYTQDIDDFAIEFGYEKIKDCINAYGLCKKTYNDLHRLFTKKELEILESENK